MFPAAKTILSFLSTSSGHQEGTPPATAAALESAVVGVLAEDPTSETLASFPTYRRFLDAIRGDGSAEGAALARKISANVGKLLDFVTAASEEEVGTAFRHLVAHTTRQFRALSATRVLHIESTEAGGGVADALVPECVEKLLATKTHAEILRRFCAAAEPRDFLFWSKCRTVSACLQPHQVGLPRSLTHSDFDATWGLVASEMGRLASFRSPRDKLVCLCNASRLLVGMLSACREREAAAGPATAGGAAPAGDAAPATGAPTTWRSPAGADDLLPAIAYAVARVNPPLLCANLRYVRELRGEDALRSEAGCYLTHFDSAVCIVGGWGPDTIEALSADEAHEWRVRLAAPPDPALWRAALSAARLEQLLPDPGSSLGDADGVTRAVEGEAAAAAALSCLHPAPAASEAAPLAVFDAWLAERARFCHLEDPSGMSAGQLQELLQEYRNMHRSLRAMQGVLFPASASPLAPVAL